MAPPAFYREETMEITLRGRKIPLLYTTYEMMEIQEQIAPLDEFQYIIFGQQKDEKEKSSLYGSPEHLTAVARLVRILGNAGLEENGEAPDLTDKWVMRALRPAELAEAVNACLAAMNEGMASEIPDKKKEGPVDVTLEEMNKKKEAES